MSFRPSVSYFVLAAAVVAASTTIPATAEFLSEAARAATASTGEPILSDPIAAVTPDAARDAMIARPAQPGAEPALAVAQPVGPQPVGPMTPELECMAKIVHHEAGNQSREGQLAVAQLVMNRIQSGRFASTVCGVAHQRGQFFDTRAYTPRPGPRWDMAVAVSREAMAGVTPEVVPGALFYHAAYQSPPRFFRTRPRVMTLGDHVFYR